MASKKRVEDRLSDLESGFLTLAGWLNALNQVVKASILDKKKPGAQKPKRGPTRKRSGASQSTRKRR